MYDIRNIDSKLIVSYTVLRLSNLIDKIPHNYLKIKKLDALIKYDTLTLNKSMVIDIDNMLSIKDRVNEELTRLSTMSIHTHDECMTFGDIDIESLAGVDLYPSMELAIDVIYRYIIEYIYNSDDVILQLKSNRLMEDNGYDYYEDLISKYSIIDTDYEYLKNIMIENVPELKMLNTSLMNVIKNRRNNLIIPTVNRHTVELRVYDDIRVIRYEELYADKFTKTKYE